jgi:hypothetical protein
MKFGYSLTIELRSIPLLILLFLARFVFAPQGQMLPAIDSMGFCGRDPFESLRWWFLYDVLRGSEPLESVK